jgi:hypothetical protein
MLLRKFNFEDKKAEESFQFDKKKHLSNWEHYSNCYNYAILKIFNKGFKQNYAFDCRARAILFLVRHSLELTIKKNLETNGLHIQNTHNFEYLFPAFDEKVVVPKGFYELTKKFNHDSDGSCYRYYKNKVNEKPYFKSGDRIVLSEILKEYNQIPRSEEFEIGEICEEFEYDNKKIQWDLTLHMGESIGLSQIRTEYDNVIEFLVEGVLENEYDINKIYLPLLFLIRHALELALKSNLQAARKISPDKVQDIDFDSIHSLSKLYRYFGDDTGYLSKLDLSKMSEETKKQYSAYKAQYEELNNVIHQLDSNSLFFRFPVDTKGKIQPIFFKGDSLYKILKLYYLTDPFITFTLDVLEDEGIR